MDNKFKKKGYTLIEFLVTIFIILLLSSIFFLNYRSEEKNLALLRAAHKLANDIRRTQNMALQTEKCCGGIIPQGYGVYLNSEAEGYLIYADTYPSGGNERYDSNRDFIVEQVSFEKGIYIREFKYSNITFPFSNWSINFKPPHPKINIQTQNSSYDELLIILALKNNPNRTKTVRVNNAGLISVE